MHKIGMQLFEGSSINRVNQSHHKRKLKNAKEEKEFDEKKYELTKKNVKQTKSKTKQTMEQIEAQNKKKQKELQAYQKKVQKEQEMKQD